MNRVDGWIGRCDSLTAVDLVTGRTAVAISGGYAHTCAILDDGSVKCWGFGRFGQLGYGDSNDRGGGPDEMGDDLPAVDLGPDLPPPPPPPDTARLYVAQKNDDKLVLRVDDEVEDSTYFFVDYAGRVRVNSNVFDEAAETFVVNGTSRFRGDVFLDDSNVPLREQLHEHLIHAEPSLLV